MNRTILMFSDIPTHLQGVERVVKWTTEASKTVYGQEARHKFGLVRFGFMTYQPL